VLKLSRQELIRRSAPRIGGKERIYVYRSVAAEEETGTRRGFDLTWHHTTALRGKGRGILLGRGEKRFVLFDT